jgi:hypothetical protein
MGLIGIMPKNKDKDGTSGKTREQEYRERVPW